MEANEYFDVLRKRWVTIAATLATALAVAVVTLLTVTPTYRASSQVYVAAHGGSSLDEMIQGSNFTVRKVKSYAELATSPRVLEPVIETVGLDDSTTSLAARVEAEQPADTVLITLSVSDASPDIAAQTADAIAENLSVVVPELERSAESTQAPVAISVVRNATVPARPISPNATLTVTLAMLLGLFAGVGLAFLREVLDTKIRSQADVQKLTDASLIGAITFDDHAVGHPLIVQESPGAPRAEAFRRLRTNLQFLEPTDGSRIFVITSALPGEGKSTTSINLAITLADAGSRVLLVDADLRRPSVSGYLGLEGSVGLTTMLIGKVEAADAVQPWGTSTLHILPSGQVPPNPSELLGSPAMAALLTEFGEAYDVVIIDTAPLLPVTDGAILAKMTGGAVVVVGAGITHRRQVSEALGALRTAGAKVLGVVVNRLSPVERPGYGYDGYYSHAPTDQDPIPSRSSGELPRHGRRDRAVSRLLTHLSHVAKRSGGGTGRASSENTERGGLRDPAPADVAVEEPTPVVDAETDETVRRPLVAVPRAGNPSHTGARS